MLKKMHKILGTDAGETLRNRNGAYMKMMNFRSIDPAFKAQGKAGMKSGGKLEKVVWYKFVKDPVALKLEADRIRKAVEKADVESLAALPNEDEVEGEEGGVVMRLHKRYERDRSLSRKKIVSAKKAGSVECEVCEFDFEAAFGELGDGFIEVHHLKPVHTLGKGSKTRLKDLALLCANCHRMAHRKRIPLSLDELRAARRSAKTRPT
ncbi:HNH endonuclease [Erythrobacter sp. NAP1]|nr:HNH endonuclease [Erythrobacter sp. NAP1]